MRFLPESLPELFRITARNDYPIEQVHVVTPDYIDQLRQATASVMRVYRAILPLVQEMSDEDLVGLGISKNLMQCVRIGYPDVEATIVGRFDFIDTPEGPKVIEFNAETPYFSIESHRISGEMCLAKGYLDPNAGAEAQLQNILVDAARKISRGGRIVITGHQNVEDDITARYAAELMGEVLGKVIDFAGVRQLNVQPDGLYDTRGRIDVLYTFYPLELFADDPGGTALFRLIAEDKVRLMNPPASNLLQNKALYILIWTFFEQRGFFDEEHLSIIEKYFLPTYAYLPDDEFDYVQKPVYGREGNSVTIIRRSGIVSSSPRMDYAQHPMVYQKRIDMPLITFEHPHRGKTIGHAVVSCFIVGGIPTAVGLRVGNEISDRSVHFMPLGYATA